MSIMSGSGKRTGDPFKPCPDYPADPRPTLSPGYVLALRWTRLASPALVALAAWAVRRLS
jgi:hypothetical protein